MARRNQPGASLFGNAVAQHRRRRPSTDDESLSYSDESNSNHNHHHSSSIHEESGDDDAYSDAGTIYSTRESARRTPEQLKREEMVRKNALLQELIQM